ncbi:MAG: MG2 domain-containing protein, partial [Polaromonas sp.]
MASNILTTAAVICLAVFTLPAQALQITSLSPQGEVARVRQVVAKFDDSAVKFGDPKAAAPLALSCSDAQATQGSGRWVSDREWAFEFERDLPPGVRCQLTAKAGFKSGTGASLTGPSSYTFNIGGPFVQNVRPGSYERIDEEQYFVLQLNGPATLKSVQANISCAIEGLGERVPVKLIDGPARADLLKARGLDKAAALEPLAFVTLACNRRLTANAKLQLVYGQGVATPSGVANSVEKRFNYQVREPFTASFSCERENAQSACLPLRPMRLDFNAPVPRQLAEAIRLNGGPDTLKPTFDSEGDAQDAVNSVSFKPLFAESTPYSLTLPANFKDASGRTLRNADSFPLKVATGAMPPLAKFAASPFGIVERFAEPGTKGNDPALLPVTLRNVEAALQVKGFTPGQVSDLNPKTDAEIIRWFRKVQRYDDYEIPRKMVLADTKQPLPKVLEAQGKDYVQSRMVSLLAGQAGVKTLDLPKPVSNEPRPFEVVGIPLSPGFHVVEIASQKLGTSLLDERHGNSRTMYVRTSALVTNLGVHFKLGRDNALAWVTTLDKGQPVANAVVRVSDCSGKQVAQGTTNAQGLAQFTGISPEPERCPEGNAYFVSARASNQGVEDMAFTWSDWHKGIEPWRFNVPTSRDAWPDERAHTIFDRTLLRAGETVSMKHLLRTETRTGFGLAELQPTQLIVTHVGSGQQYTQPLAWRKTATGGQSAESTFAIPPAAKLGLYEVQLQGERNTTDGRQERNFSSGQFRVEEFRLPVLEGRITPTGKGALVKATAVPTDVQINYVAGGGAANLPVRVSALVRGKSLNFSDYEDFSFSPPRGKQAATNPDSEEETTS